MIRTVRANKSRFSPPLWSLLFGRDQKKYVAFHPNCRYNLNSYDQDDWNKLFGKMPISIKGHQYNSFRFVWRYNLKERKIELGAYIYQEGVLIKESIGFVHMKESYALELKQIGNKVHFLINGVSVYSLVGRLPLIGWQLGAYFGGNIKAPHEMDIYIS